MNSATATTLARAGMRASSGERAVRATGSLTACVAVCVLLLAIPFETMAPVFVWGGQSVTSAEAVLVVMVLLWLLAAALTAAPLRWRMPHTVAWAVLLGVSGAAALSAPAFRGNAINMTLRLTMAAVVFLLTVNGVTTWTRLRAVAITAATTGVMLSALLVADYLGADSVRRILTAFRSGIAVVGAHVRATGPFQYPTIASMYLEILFALSLPLLAMALDRARPLLALAATAATVAIAAANTLTFTRAGVVTMIATLGVLAFLRVRREGWDRAVAAYTMIALVIVGQFLVVRPVESLALRLTSEGQERWYGAAIDAPAHIDFQTGGTSSVSLVLTNTGRVTWDSTLPQPFRVSYHWLTADGTQVVSWEGRRTLFPHPIVPGERVALNVEVGAPRQPGSYRVMWDIEQEHRLWFSTEPAATTFVSTASVSGPALGAPGPLKPLPVPLRQETVRPGRVMLWRTAARMTADHPLFGVGPDNYRMRYGAYLQIAAPDTRIHSNNMYLDVLTGGGLAGAAAFALLAALIARSAVRALRRLGSARESVSSGRHPLSDARSLVAGVVAAATAIALHGLVDSFLSFTATYVLIAITLGLVVAAEALSQQHAHRV